MKLCMLVLVAGCVLAGSTVRVSSASVTKEKKTSDDLLQEEERGLLNEDVRGLMEEEKREVEEKEMRDLVEELKRAEEDRDVARQFSDGSGPSGGDQKRVFPWIGAAWGAYKFAKEVVNCESTCRGSGRGGGSCGKVHIGKFCLRSSCVCYN